MAGIDLTVVHVRDEVARQCRVGLVIARGGIPADGRFPELTIRVVRPSGVGPVGIDDDEGRYRHTSDRQWVAGRGAHLAPDGNGRYLDHWHRIGSCGYDSDAPAGAGEAVEASRG